MPYRRILALGLVGCTAVASCASWPGLDDPLWSVSPEMTMFRMRGDTRMESGTPPQRNAPISTSSLAADDRDENPGVTISWGDGFSGFDLHYAKFESFRSQSSLATADWGAIPQGVEVNTHIDMDEFRLRYIAGIVDWRDADDEYWFKAGLGALLGHKEMSLEVVEVNRAAAQRIEIKDDVSPMVAARLAAGRGPIALTVDFAYNDDWKLGTGDIEGEFFDLSVMARYFLEDQDLTVFGGYRRFELPARGNESVFEWDVDFTFDGYVFGIEFAF